MLATGLRDPKSRIQCFSNSATSRICRYCVKQGSQLEYDVVLNSMCRHFLMAPEWLLSFPDGFWMVAVMF